jgi:hypothetical protein
MEDLSHLLPGDPITALAPTSQAGGNMMSDNKLAHTAPGSQPVDPLPPAKEQADPEISASNSSQIKPGTTGKPDARAGGMTASPPAWSKTTRPEVIRES